MDSDRNDLTLPETDRQELIIWAAECVGRLLPVFTAAAPGDDRLERALAAAGRFARGELGVGAMRQFAFECHAAAREVADPAATAVARACGQAVAVAHMAGHSRELARYTRKALGDRAEDELAWQRRHVPERFTSYVYGDDDVPSAG